MMCLVLLNGLGCQLTLTRNIDNTVLNKDDTLTNAKIKHNGIELYVPLYTSSVQQQAMLFRQFTSKTPTELQYVERSVFMKEVNTQNFWTFELGTQERINVPIWTNVGFKQRDRQDSQNLNNDIFSRPPVTSDQCIIGTQKYSESGI